MSGRTPAPPATPRANNGRSRKVSGSSGDAGRSLSARGSGRKDDNDDAILRNKGPRPPGGRLTRKEQKEKPDHVTRTGFFAQREAGFQVGFVAPTGSSLPATSDKKPRELFRSAGHAIRSTNLLNVAHYGSAVTGALNAAAEDPDPELLALDHAHHEAASSLAHMSSDHRLLNNMSGTRFFAQSGSLKEDSYENGPQGEKEHHVRAAQALWSTNDGIALSLQEFANIHDHQGQLAALHQTDAHSDSDEEQDAMEKQRQKQRPKSVGRLSRVNMPEHLPVEVFLDEYPREIIDYLRSRWGSKHLREKQRRKLRTIRFGLRRSLGPSKQLRKVMWTCGFSAVILMALVIYFGVSLYHLSAELWDLENPPAVPDPNNVKLKLYVARHDIALTAAGTSRVCKTFPVAQITDRQRIVSITPDLVSTSTREVVQSIGVYATACTTDDCLSGVNFDCEDHYGGTDSKLLMRCQFSMEES